MARVFAISLTLELKLHDLFRIIYDLMRVRNPKTTINNKVRAIEQMFVLAPVK